jgi:hypothetical protein
MGKQLITTDITSTRQMPIRKMTLDHLQQAFVEPIRALARAIGTDDEGGTPGTPAQDIVYGLQSTTVGSTFTCNRGAVYSSGEIFQVPAASFTIGGGEYPIFILGTAYATGDPTEFTDSNLFNIHRIRTLRVVSGTTSTANYFGKFSDFTNKMLASSVDCPLGGNTSAGVVTAKRNRDGLVTLKGTVTMNGSFILTNVLATIPAGYRPPATVVAVVGTLQGLTFELIVVTIGTSGQILASGDPNSVIANNTVVFLDSISFYNS